MIVISELINSSYSKTPYYFGIDQGIKRLSTYTDNIRRQTNFYQ